MRNRSPALTYECGSDGSQTFFLGELESFVVSIFLEGHYLANSVVEEGEGRDRRTRHRYAMGRGLFETVTPIKPCG